MPKKPTKAKKPNAAFFKQMRDVEAAFHQAMHRIDLAEAESRGMHKARAELMVPMLTVLKSNADTCGSSTDHGIALNSTDCLLLLACLKEAGYMPIDDKANTAAMIGRGGDSRIVRMPTAAPPPDSGEVVASPELRNAV